MTMDPSPCGREIEFITGDAHAIVRHGSDIASLGRQMIASAALLERIADGAEGKGYSMEALRDEVGDLYRDLDRAGRLYEPSGDALLAYGRALGEVQPQLRRVVGECEILWAAYAAARERRAELSIVTVDAPPGGEAGEDDDRLATARLDESSARTAWELEAAKFDPLYDTWDAAYDSALAGLDDANDSGVKDGFWENALPFVEGAIAVLGWVGLAVGLLAIVFSAPFLGLLAAVIGVIALALEIARRFGGRGTNLDLAMAIIGVVPFGRIGSFIGKGRSAFTGILGDVSGLTGLRQARAFDRFAEFARNLPVTNSRGGLTQNTAIIQRFRDYADDIGDLPFRSPSGWLDRVRYGENGDLHRGITDALAGMPPQYADRIREALDAGGLGGLIDPISKAEVAGNVVDSLKTLDDAAGAVGEVKESVSDSPTDRWSDQLARSR